MLPSHFEEKSNFTNKNILYLFNRTIYEYDIHSADINLCIRYKILSEDKIEKILKLDKIRRVVQIGKWQKDKEFRDKLKDAFSKIRKEFYEANNLDITDIIAVKKDAIFTTKQCEVTTFGNVEFQIKNMYTSFIQIKNLEFYYGNGKCDVKGIDDEYLKLHENGIMKIVKLFFKKMETGSVQDTLIYLNRMCSNYKLRQLPLEYYREFNVESKYTVMNQDDTFDDYWEDNIDELNITYNYINILIPLVKIAL